MGLDFKIIQELRRKGMNFEATYLLLIHNKKIKRCKNEHKKNMGKDNFSQKKS